MWIGLIGAILGYVLGGTGLVSQVITWRKIKTLEEGKIGVAKIASDVEIAKVASSVAVHEREQTGRFQVQLLDRLEKIEQMRASDGNRISELEEHNSNLMGKLEEIATLHGKLLGEHDQLKQDHEQLKRHVARLESDNASMRRRLKLVAP